MPLKNRIASFDGLRAIAIFSVILFHYFTRGPEKYNANFPYGGFFEHFILFNYGYLGVLLFFSISGFVITHSLQRSPSLKNFGIKRIARLWPSMLLCCAITYAFSSVAPLSHQSHINNFLPSLTFLDPRIFNFIFKTNSFDWMDGAYWSIFVDIRFYAILALIYFINKKKFFKSILILSTSVGIIFPLAIYFDLENLRSKLDVLLIAEYLPWFIFGIGCFYLYYRETKRAIALIAASSFSVVLYVLAATTKPYLQIDWSAQIIGSLIIFTLMIGSFKNKSLNKILSTRFLSSIGLASYSLYLLHQELGYKIIVQIGNPFRLNQMFSGLYALIPLSLLTVLSHIIYQYWENPSNRIINDLFNQHSRDLHPSPLSSL